MLQERYTKIQAVVLKQLEKKTKQKYDANYSQAKRSIARIKRLTLAVTSFTRKSASQYYEHYLTMLLLKHLHFLDCIKYSRKESNNVKNEEC